MQVSGASTTIKDVMAAKSPKRKMVYAIQAGVWTIFFLICGSIYLARLNNVNKLNSAVCDVADCGDVNFYDVMFFSADPSDYSDAKEALSLIADLTDWD